MRPWLVRTLLVTAIVTTSAFALSIPFSFGIATHRHPNWTWYYSRPGVGLAQVYCGSGQFHLTVDLAAPHGNGTMPLAARQWQAGVMYSPHFHFGLNETDRLVSKLGFDGFVIESGTYWSVGVVGLYPAVVAWVLWGVARRRTADHLPGRCRSCGYDLRATPTRCPECGAAAGERFRSGNGGPSAGWETV